MSVYLEISLLEDLKLNEYSFEKINHFFSDYLKNFDYQPEIFDETLEIVKRLCMLPGQVKGYGWKFKFIEVGGQPFNPIINIDTGERCAIGENIEIDAKELLKNPLTPIGRCPRSHIIPRVDIIEKDGKKYIEEIGGCGRVYAYEADIGGRGSSPGKYMTEHSVALQKHQSVFYDGPLFSQVLTSYQRYGWLTPDQLDELTEL